MDAANAGAAVVTMAVAGKKDMTLGVCSAFLNETSSSKSGRTVAWYGRATVLARLARLPTLVTSMGFTTRMINAKEGVGRDACT